MTGFISTPPTQTIAFVSASVIAPGFEPLAKVPMGAVLGRWRTIAPRPALRPRRYALIALAAALAYLVLEATGAAAPRLLAITEVDKLANPIPLDILVSSAAAVAA